MDDFFDIIVVGPHLGGMLAAALLVKRGKRALLLAVSDKEENDIRETDPRTRVFTSLAGRWFLDKAMYELAALPGRTRFVKSLVPSVQIIMPHIRINVQGEDPDPLGHLAEEFNEDPKQVRRLFSTLNRLKDPLSNYFINRSPQQPRGLRGLIKKSSRSLGLISLHKAGRKYFGDLLDRYQFGPPFRAALMSQIMAFSRFYSLNPSLTSAAHSLGVVQEGVQGLSFERPSLASALRSFILDRGGVIIPDADIREFHYDSTHTLAIHLEGKYLPYRCHHVLVNTDMRWFNKILPEDIKNHKYSRRIQGIQAAGFNYRMQFHIQRNGVPIGMGENVLFIVDPEEPLWGDNFISLALGPHDDPSADPSEARIITATCRIPLTLDHLNAQWMAELGQRVQGHIKTMIPFFEQYLVHISHSTLPSMDPGTAGGCPDHTWLFESSFSPSMGISLLPNITPYPNIFLTGDEVLPGLGTDGMIISGCLVADMIASRTARTMI